MDARGRGRLDFGDYSAARALTAALLAADFGLAWWLPDGHLVPTLTSRLNYLLWVEDLLGGPQAGPGPAARGLDVGTGASAIYALLGAAVCGWRVVGTDCTDAALSAAARNIAANPRLAQLLSLRDARPAPDCTDPGQFALLSGVLRPGERFDFTVCNPPFFEDAAAPRNEAADCGGTSAELATPGGEGAFVSRMLAESRQAAGAVRLFTTLCGRKETLRAALAQLRALRAPMIRTQTFLQGRVSRWGLAWSWSEAAPPRAPPRPQPRPLARAAMQLRCGRAPRGAAAAEAARALLDACSPPPPGALVAACALDAAGFTLTGTVQPAAHAGGKRGRDEDAPGPCPPVAFSVAVSEAVPGALSISAALRGGEGADARAQAAFGALVVQWREALGRRWPD